MSNRAVMMAGIPTGTAPAGKTLPPIDWGLSWLAGSRVSYGEAMPERAALIEAQIPELRRLARILLRGDREAADDLVQDTLERALARWRLLRAEGNLRGWLYTILYNRFLTDRHRSRRRGPHDELTEDVELPGIDGGQNAALEHRDLLRVFSALPGEQRLVLLLIGIDDFSYDEAARVLGVPIGTVMSRLSRARERLRRDMYGDATESSLPSAALWRVK
jgi:RNA polymerase sigma-70 factor (ECF subfamily)